MQMFFSALFPRGRLFIYLSIKFLILKIGGVELQNLSKLAQEVQDAVGRFKI